MTPRAPAERRARLDFARGYPFEIPHGSFLYVNGSHHPLLEHGTCPIADGVLEVGGAPVPAADHLARAGIDPGPGLGGRIPVLAVGSNQSPAQLGRKFGRLETDVVIPVSRCRLADFDSVFACHLTQYGSVPATVQHAPGCTVTLSVNWLTESQLAVMHPTEIAASNYAYARLSGLDLRLEGGVALDAVHAYVGRHGILASGGRPIAVAAVTAEGRHFPAMSQAEVQGHVRDRLAPGTVLDDFILGNVDDPGLRRARTERLKADALDFAWPALEIVKV